MDKAAIIAEIAARHGVRLDPDDPAFLLVDMNLLALASAKASLAETAQSLQNISREIENKTAAALAKIDEAASNHQKTLAKQSDMLAAKVSDAMGALALSGAASKPVTMNRKDVVETLAPVVRMELDSKFGNKPIESGSSKGEARLSVWAYIGIFVVVFGGIVVALAWFGPATEKSTAAAAQAQTYNQPAKVEQRRR